MTWFLVDFLFLCWTKRSTITHLLSRVSCHDTYSLRRQAALSFLSPTINIWNSLSFVIYAGISHGHLLSSLTVRSFHFRVPEMCMYMLKRCLSHEANWRPTITLIHSFIQTLSSPTTSSTDALISRMRKFDRPQRDGTYEGMTSRYVTVVFVYCGAKQPTP